MLEIVRQHPLWIALCLACCAVLWLYALAGRQHGIGRRLLLPGLPTAVTLTVVFTPALATPLVGIVWTLVLVLAVSVAFYLNLGTSLSRPRLGVLLGLRILALLLLVPTLFEPVLKFITRPQPTRPVLVLTDASASMSIPDAQNGPTRLQTVAQSLLPQVNRLSEHFLPGYYTFADRLQPIDNPRVLASATADGQCTDLVRAAQALLAAQPNPDAVLLLISDGIDNVSADAAIGLRALGRPVHTVLVGSAQAQPSAMANVTVADILSDGEMSVGSASNLTAVIRSTGLADGVVEVKLAPVDGLGRPQGTVQSQSLVLRPLPEGQRVDFSYTPTAVGVQRLAVWVDPLPAERTAADNRQQMQALALDPRIKVLYLEGRARPEYRELNRALARDQNMEAVSLLRIQADRFVASGNLDGKPYPPRLPMAREDFRRFDVIIVGDLDASFLTRGQQQALEEAVADGSALLMLGGQTSFGPGNYRGTPVERALPVTVGDADSAQEKTEFVPRLTAEGLAHPVMEGLGDWFSSAESPAKQQLPPLRGNVVVAAPRAGASVLLEHPTRPGPDGRPQVILAVHRYGKGRAAAFTADTTYLWYLPMRALGQESPYNRFWGQLVRWLAGADVRNRQQGAGVVGLMNKTVFQLGESPSVRALVRDERGDVTRFAQVSVEITPSVKLPAAAGLVTVAMPASEARTGLYEAAIPPQAKGDYLLKITAGKDGKVLGTQDLAFTVIAPAEEMLRLAANSDLMRRIASETGGSSYTIGQLPELIDELIQRYAPAGERRQVVVPLHSTLRGIMALAGNYQPWPNQYDLPMQAGLVVLLLTVEWLLRRRWQLP